MSTVMPPEIAALMGATVSVSSQTGIDGYGKMSYTARSGSPFKCYPVYEQKLVWSQEGREEMSSVTVYIDSDVCQVTDRFTFNGVNYRCLSLQTWVDDTNAVWGQVAYLQ